ncbi:hypothetical protein J1N35_022476 [Gossypium stocksii]|uniref:Uncharacterized protein n=1 Tax=Gossypium stocksii TaxID=47602 RepID=A0A9D3VG73_9ROSI|nr:hypothetical protein J1N35_022476 [Gossypium stocksii]
MGTPIRLTLEEFGYLHLPSGDRHSVSFDASLSFLLINVFKFFELVFMSSHLYLSFIVPINALSFFNLWFYNSAYIYLFVSFIQILKALMLVSVFPLVLMGQVGSKHDINILYVF